MQKFTGWNSDWQGILAACREKFPTDYAHTLRVADEVCANTFLFGARWEMEPTHIPVTFENGEIDWELMPDGDEEWVFALNRHTYLVDVGHAYQATGDEKYPAAFVRLLEHWWSHTALSEATKNTTWRSLEAGLRAEFWLRALFLMEKSPALTPAFMEKFNAGLAQHAQYLAEKHGPFDTLSNWGVIQDHGLVLLGLYLGNEEWVNLALSRLNREIEVQVLADGAQWEQSPMYHCEVLHACLDSILAARSCGYPVPARFEGAVQGMVRALGGWISPDRVMPAQSDSDFIFSKDMLVAGALLFQDGVSKTMAGEGVCYENLWDFGPGCEAAYAALPAQDTPCSIALPDSGNYTLRDHWGETANWLRFHCGCMGSGHGHSDQLHIDLSAYGQRILIDAGRFTYVPCDVRLLLKNPASHNTTRVDDTDFTQCIESWGYGAIGQALKGEYRFTPDMDYLSGAHLGYMNLAGGGLLVARKIVYLKPDIFVIFDEFFGAGEHTYQQYFHFDLEGRAALQGRRVEFTSPKAQATLFCLGDGLEMKLVRAAVSPVYNHMQQGQCLEVRRSGAGVPGFVTVISTAPAGAASDVQAELLPVYRLPAGIELPAREAQAVRIVKDGKEAVVMLTHEDVNGMTEVRAGQTYSSYGRVVVFDEKHSGGLCLAW